MSTKKQPVTWSITDRLRARRNLKRLRVRRLPSKDDLNELEKVARQELAETKVRLGLG